MNFRKNEIMVVDKKALFEADYFEGFRPVGLVDYESRILKNHVYRERNRAEEDPAFKQPIGYAIIVNPRSRKVFTYRRSSRDSDYQEKRLQGKWSWGVGGHIEKDDTGGGNPIRESILREIREEIRGDDFSPPEVLGYINDDRDEVGRVHFGILYVVKTAAEVIKPQTVEISDGGLRMVADLEKIISSPGFTVEEWSRISLPPLISYLQNR